MAPRHCRLHTDLATTKTVIPHECVVTMALQDHRSPLLARNNDGTLALLVNQGACNGSFGVGDVASKLARTLGNPWPLFSSTLNGYGCPCPGKGYLGRLITCAKDAAVRCITFLEGTVSCKSTINLCFTMPATFIFTKFEPNKLNNYLRYATVALST